MATLAPWVIGGDLRLLALILPVAIAGCQREPAEPPLALCDAPHIERDELKCRDYREWTDTQVTNLADGGCSVCNDMIYRVPAK